ncbi:MAG: DUF5591 domain-containing protein [Methanomicrobiaceae archaeon]|nr:DUF5591 domain-containing protein [Methanomicrobiaceae archaeon]
MFEVIKREGPARTGVFSEGEITLNTPCATDTAEIFPSLRTMAYSNVPLQAGSDFCKKYLKQYDNIFTSHPSDTAKAETGSVVMVPGWHTALPDPRNYVKWIIEMKSRHPPDTMWYSPACALPSNIATLIASGFDLFDYTAVDLKTSQGVFCNSDGEYPAEECMGTGICRCEGCLKDDLKLHNRIALDSEIAKIILRINEGNLREYLEKQSLNSPQLVSILRLFDREYDFIEKSTPIARPIRLYSNSGDSINRPEIKRFGQRVLKRYTPSRTDAAVILPCSARKPYSSSQSHRKFMSTVRDRAHEIILTSPLALVPRELEGVYPAGHYDIPVTGYWDMEERKIIGAIVEEYFTKNRYGHVFVHLNGDAAEIVKNALERTGTEATFTAAEGPTSHESLRNLDRALSGLPRKSHNYIRGMLSWQFGEDTDTSGMMIKGRFGNRKILKNKKQLFSIDNETGLYRPTFEGWETIVDRYIVEIDDFIPQGDILAPGVVSCDPEIRPGDEVFVRGQKAVATGRAAMGADEMVRSQRGVAVKVRKVKKI